MVEKMQFNLGDLKINDWDDHEDETVSVKEVRDSDIAVIGLSCRIGESRNADEFWKHLMEGKDLIRPFPAARKEDLHSLFETGFLDENEKLNEGAFLEEINSFDHDFFKLSPAEARLMDPNQRMFLESAWSAIEDAGYGGNKLSNSRTGVYVGYSNDFSDEYKRLIAELAPASVSASIPGNIHSIIASRISYLLNLKGPSLLVDTACSSSLVAVHLACKDLRQGDCEVAIAGGVKITLLPVKHGEGGGLGVGSADDRTRTFDSASDGTGGGEGVVSFLLKPLKRALQDHDDIYAVIKGGAVNNDGASAGITAPNSLAEEDVIVSAWNDAEVEPETICYIEAHGTGTKLGDPIEVDGIKRAFQQYTDRKQFCAIGSVKTNVGHLDHCAGIAGFLKTVLALKHGKIPAHLHFKHPNPEIRFIESPVYVNDRMQTWTKRNGPRRCGVSSFGLSGTNCHLVLEEAPHLGMKHDSPLPSDEMQSFDDQGFISERAQIFTLSAKNKTVLSEYLKKYQHYLRKGYPYSLRDICYTASTGRGHYNYRLAVICESLDDLKRKLLQIEIDALDFEQHDMEISPGTYLGYHKVISAHKEKEYGEWTVEEFNAINENGEAEINNLPDGEEKLKAICRLYSSGGDIDWEDLYKGTLCKKVRIPVYPFERKRCWLEVEQEALESLAKSDQATGLHPLLDDCLAESENQEIFVTRFSAKRHWVLREHMIMDNCIIPGTTYLEMVREALRKYSIPGKILELNDIHFISPLIIEEGDEKEVQTIIKREGQAFQFVIVSRSEVADNPWEQQWIRHAEGRAAYIHADRATMDLDAVRRECNGQEHIVSEDDKEATTAFEFGPRWKSIQKIEIGENRVLAELELDQMFHKDLNEYALHPALLDAAVGVASQSLGNGLFLPFSYRQMRIHGSLPDHFYSYIKKKPKAKESGEILSVDILIFDLSGQLLLEIEDYSVKRVRESELQLNMFSDDHVYHQIGWVKQDKSIFRETPAHRSLDQGYALLFSDGSQLSTVLYHQLMTEGYKVVEVHQGSSYEQWETNKYTLREAEEDYRRLLEELREQKVTKIVHLWGCQAPRIKVLDQTGSLGEQNILGLFSLAKVLAEEKVSAELVVIANSAYEVTGEENNIYPESASLFGMAKVIEQENSRLTCRCFDIDNTTEPETMARVMMEKDQPFLTAIRKGDRYTEQLQPVLLDDPPDTESIHIRDKGVYVLTGGSGGLGIEMAKWLASNQQVTLALIASTPLPHRAEWTHMRKSSSINRTMSAIQELESAGAIVEYYCADITDTAATNQVLQEIRQKYGAINGLIHAAGVAGDGFISLKSKENVRKVLAPKIQGTHVIDQLTDRDSMDFLILFSSVTSLTGGPGQGDYTAANAYMDAYTHMRNRKGKRTITINWAPWKETGMAVDHHVDFEAGLFKALSNKTALSAFEEILRHPQQRVIVGAVQYSQAALLNDEIPIGLSPEIRVSLEKHRRDRNGSAIREGKQQRTLKIVGRPQGTYSNTEKIIAEIWAEVLGLDQIDIYDNFYELGGDSLIASQIVGEINRQLPTNIDISDIFNYMSVHELAQFLGGSQAVVESGGESSTQGNENEEGHVIAPVEKRLFYPVTSVQRRFYMMRQMAGESTLNNLCSAMTITGPLNHVRLERSIKQVIQRHGSLRTAFEWQENELVQKVYNEVPFSLEYDEADSRELAEYVDDFIQPFQLDHAPLLRAKLIRMADDYHLFLCDVDHIAADGASIGILLNEMIKGYSGDILPEIGVQYVDFTIWQNQRMNNAELKRQEAFWMKIYNGELPVLDLPTDLPREAQMNNSGDVFTFEISEGLTDLAKKAAAQNGVTLFMLLFSVYSTMLAKYANSEDIIVGVPSAGRELNEIQHTIGLFINTMALRTFPNAEKIFTTYLQEVKEHSLEAYKNEEYPFEKLLNKLNLPKDLSRNQLFDVQFISQNFSGETLTTEGLQFTPLETKMEAVQVDLTVIWYERDGRLRFLFEYATSLFNKSTMERLAVYYENILREVIRDPSRPIGQIPMMTVEEQYQMVYEWNDTQMDYPEDRTIQEMFEEQVDKTPDRTAVVYNNRSFTYRSLNRQANQLARQLLSHNLKSGQVVGIAANRSPDMLIGMLAVLKAGAAYLPLDPGYPEERIAYMMKDSRMALLLTSSAEGVAQYYRGPIIELSDKEIYTGDSSNLAISTDPQDLAYIIYTSGTSGKPKGVMVENRNVVHYITAFQHEFGLKKEDVVLQQASSTFDASVEEIYPILTTGGRLVIVSYDELVDTGLLEEVIQKHEVTLLSTSPFILNQLNQRSPLPSIHTYISGGDVLKKGDVTNLLKYAEVYNTYGPTEATVCSTYYRLTEHTTDPIPIGAPIANVEVYILNRHLEIVPVGVPGEIYISGEGVARGYVNQPELTENAFLSNPWKSGERIYKTGDRGKYLPDGNIQFLGRMDQQINMRGYRIEPEEIEIQLLQHPSIQDVVVVDQEIQPGIVELCSYVVTQQQNPTVVELKEFIRPMLPEYMIPNYFIKLDTIPRSANGKIDRKALPKVDGSVEAGTEFIPPTTSTEQRLAQLWSKTLHQKKIGILDDFFLIGGQSLLATKLVYQINREWNINITLRDFFQARTIQGLATHIEAAQSRRAEQHLAVQEGLIKPFNLRRHPLFRTALIHLPGNRHLLFMDMHHIITDALSQEIIMDEFSKLYQGMELPDLPIQYKDFSAWQRNFVNSESFQAQEQFWLEQFQEDIPTLQLPFDYPRPKVRRGEGKTIYLQLGSEWAHRVKRFSVGHNATAFMVLFAAYNILLSKYSGSEDIIVGVPVSGRTHASLSPLIGMFVNTLPLRNTPRNDMTVQEFIHQVKEGSLLAFDHQDYPFEKLVDKLNVGGKTDRNPLFDTMFTANNEAVRSTVEIPGLKLTPHNDLEYKGAQFDLTFNATLTEEDIEFHLQYDVDLFTENTVKHMGQDFLHILYAVLTDPSMKIGDLQLDKLHQPPRALDSDDATENKEQLETPASAGSKMEESTQVTEELLVQGLNSTEMNAEKMVFVHQWFEEQVEQTPERTALVYGDTEMTYHELNRRANQVAHRLLKYGVKQDDIVGVVTERSLEMMVALLGILKAGAAFLPINPTDPQERMQKLLGDSNVEIILTHQQCYDSWMDEQAQKVVDVGMLNKDQSEWKNPHVQLREDSLAFVIYTSGSTGQPKGVMLEHKAFSSRMNWLYRELNIDEDIVLQQSTYSFDATMVELFSWFKGGGRLVLLEEGAEKDLQQIFKTINDHKVTVSFFVPTLLQVFISTLTEEEAGRLHSLRWVMAGGEELSREMVQSFITKLPNTELLNIYGPTEATIFATAYNCSFASLDRSIPIGQPLSDTRAYVLNENQEILSVGEVGELYLGGSTLARGYLNRPDLTAEKFISNPFVPGERIYQTGDLAYILPDGNLGFLGRIDHQVKIRGYRIEVSEIEGYLVQFPAIHQAAVIARTDQEGNKYLGAYLVTTSSCTVQELREFLRERLPEYMIPLIFMKVERMPLLSNGKLDRKTLSHLGEELPSGMEHVSASNETERILVNRLKEILKTGAVGIEDHFFELGGDSLLSHQLTLFIKQEFRVEVSVKDLFKAPTVQELARLINTRQERNEVEAGSIQENSEAKPSQIPVAPQAQYYPVSSAQMRLFIIHELNQRDLSYNLPGLITLEGSLDLTRLEQTLQALIQRHEAFRTSFDVVEGEIVQLIHDTVSFSIDYFKTDVTDIEKIMSGEGKLVKADHLEEDYSLSSVKVEKKKRRRKEL